MIYTTTKRKAKRFFYKNRQRVAFYTIEKEGKDWLELVNHRGPVFRADIRLERGFFKDDVTSLGIHGTDFAKFGTDKIKEFLRSYLDIELGELMCDCLSHDLFSNPLLGKEKVRFT